MSSYHSNKAHNTSDDKESRVRVFEEASASAEKLFCCSSPSVYCLISLLSLKLAEHKYFRRPPRCVFITDSSESFRRAQVLLSSILLPIADLNN